MSHEDNTQTPQEEAPLATSTQEEAPLVTRPPLGVGQMVVSVELEDIRQRAIFDLLKG